MLVTFCVISYNQEDTILETLESISYQVSKYGKNKEFQLIISDDGSTDRTYILENNWVSHNRDAFTEIIVLPSDTNRGTVENTLRSYKNIKGDYYKLIGGDDLFADSDFLSKINNKDFYIFSNFMFQNYRLSYKMNQYRHYYFWDCTFERLREYSRFLYPFQTQTWFCSRKLNTQELYNELIKYKYVEDQPMWNYWLKNMDIRFEYINIPLTLYRSSEKSVCNPNNKFNNAVLDDELRLRKEMTKDVRNYMDRYILKSYELRKRYQKNIILKSLFTLINPHEYFVRFGMVMRQNEMKTLAYNLDKLFLKRNQLYLEVIHKRAQGLYGNFLRNK